MTQPQRQPDPPLMPPDFIVARKNNESMPLINQPWPLGETVACEVCTAEIKIETPKEVDAMTRASARVVCPLCKTGITLPRPDPNAPAAPVEGAEGIPGDPNGVSGDLSTDEEGAAEAAKGIVKDRAAKR
jgi:hypothetical protein